MYFALTKVFDFLELNEKFELAMCNKEFHGRLYEKYLDYILKFCEFDQKVRTTIWWKLVPDVIKIFKNSGYKKEKNKRKSGAK